MAGNGVTLDGPLTFTYWPLMAKGLAPVLALEWSGLPYKAQFMPGATEAGETWMPAWKAMKPTCAFGHIPSLDVPGVGAVSHEIAILNTVARLRPDMAGKSLKDACTSQQLTQEAEDIYASLVKKHPTMFAKDKVPADELAEFWATSDASLPNGKYGPRVHLANVEKFLQSAGHGEGRFTEGGDSVGELKLFAVVHQVVLCKPGILDACPLLTAFYQRVLSDPRTQKVLDGKAGGMPFALKQYFDTLK